MLTETPLMFPIVIGQRLLQEFEVLLDTLGGVNCSVAVRTDNRQILQSRFDGTVRIRQWLKVMNLKDS